MISVGGVPVSEYDEDRKLIEYRFGELREALRHLSEQHGLLAKQLAEIHSDMHSQRAVWKVLFAIASAAATVVGWFLHLWTAKP